MKTLRFIGMAIAAIALCVNLTACSSDDDGGNNENGGNGTQTTTDSFGVIKGQKKLTKLTMNDSGVSSTSRFSYDKNGRLAEVKHRETEGSDTSINGYEYEWNEKEMSVTCYDSEDHNLLFKGYIENGKFYCGTEYEWSSGTEYSTTVTYKSGKLTELKSQEKSNDGSIYREESTFVWNDDKLMSVGASSYHYTCYSYDDKTCKGYNPCIAETCVAELSPFYADWGFFLICAHPELLGLRTNYLPKTPTDDDRYYTFTHTLDDDGYITKIKYECYDYYTDIYTFTWE